MNSCFAVQVATLTPRLSSSFANNVASAGWAAAPPSLCPSHCAFLNCESHLLSFLCMFECRLDHWKFLARARKSTGTILFVVKMCVCVAILMRVRVMTAIPQNGPGIRFFDPVLPKLLMEVLIMWGSSTKNYGSEHQTWSDYRLWFVQQLWSPLKTIVFGACVYFGLRGRLKVDYCSSPSRKLTRAPQTWSKWWFPWKSQL